MCLLSTSLLCLSAQAEVTHYLDNETMNGVLYKSYSYDDQGRLNVTRTYSIDMFSFPYVNTLDSLTFFDNGKMKDHFIFSFDMQGNYTDLYHYGYDAMGNTVLEDYERWDNNEWSPNLRTENEYDEAGRKIRSRNWGLNAGYYALQGEETITYNAAGNMLEQRQNTYNQYLEEFKDILLITNVYNENEILISSEQYNWDAFESITDAHKTVNTVDNDLIVVSFHYTRNDMSRDWEPTSREEMTYNEEGVCILTRLFNYVNENWVAYQQVETEIFDADNSESITYKLLDDGTREMTAKQICSTSDDTVRITVYEYIAEDWRLLMDIASAPGYSYFENRELFSHDSIIYIEDQPVTIQVFDGSEVSNISKSIENELGQMLYSISYSNLSFGTYSYEYIYEYDDDNDLTVEEAHTMGLTKTNGIPTWGYKSDFIFTHTYSDTLKGENVLACQWNKPRSTTHHDGYYYNYDMATGDFTFTGEMPEDYVYNYKELNGTGLNHPNEPSFHVPAFSFNLSGQQIQQLKGLGITVMPDGSIKKVLKK